MTQLSLLLFLKIEFGKLNLEDMDYNTNCYLALQIHKVMDRQNHL